MPDSNLSSNFFFAAVGYRELGYSVIPLLGDMAPDCPKKPAVPWSSYQSRRATEADFQRWFMQQGFQGIGIVLGRISDLIVLDFDNPDLFYAFRAQYPDLAERQVIQTRRGFHIYFQIPAHLRVPTRKGQGIELRSDGCYVVARPTTIGGFAYKLIQPGGQPKLLIQHDLACINRFFDQHAAPSGKPVQPTIHQTEPISVLQEADLQALYCAQVGKGRGRNQSLFNVTLTARDHGWSQKDVCSTLTDLHARTTSIHAPTESEFQRRQEAQHTIKSAFSKPARPPQPLLTTSPQLPTRAREALHALQHTDVVRFIEATYQKGIQPGHALTRKQTRFLLVGLVGRDSIYHALQAKGINGEPLFERTTPPLEPPLAATAAATEKNPHTLKKMQFEGGSKSGKIQRGRKPHYYIMPTISELCRKLGVKFLSSDPMTLDDLGSAKKTRQATHREFIKRRPKQYTRRWLAQRLGVSITTLKRYNHELHIQVTPRFHQQPLTWGSLNAIPDEPHPAMFLQDENNRHYPARRAIAISLLAKGRTLTLKRQEANFYSIDPPHVAYIQLYQHLKAREERQEQIERRIAVEQGRADEIPHNPSRPAALPLSGLPPPNQPLSDESRSPIARIPRQEATPRLGKRDARKPLPNAHLEAVAQRVYNLINSRTADPTKHISLVTARCAVFTYGTQAVESVLKMVLRRQNLTNPAGFFVTVLRSESKRSSGAG